MPSAAPLPPWLKTRLPSGERFERVRSLSSKHGLCTVCEEARCPNMAECWGAGTATFMVLGEACSRSCRFCSVGPLRRRAEEPDPGEPDRLAETIRELGLRYVVLTTVCRDDLPDQGAGHLVGCMRAIRERNPALGLEVLIQDFRGDHALLRKVVEAPAVVVAHNIETVERLSPAVRDRRAGYAQSLDTLAAVKAMDPGRRTKSSLMLGLGELPDEVEASLSDLRDAGVDIVTLGQYLRPGREPRFLPVAEYVTPDSFTRYGELARGMGFREVASGPFVRSSYRAGELSRAD